MHKILKRLVLVGLLACCNFTLYAQLSYGTTGLLHMPSAEMQDDKTFMVGGNYLHKNLTPDTWNYGTYNYYFNVTIFPFLEVAYTATMFKAKTIGIDWKVDGEKFTNQDRYFSFRLRLIEEGKYWKYMPAIVVGTSDPYTESGDGQIASASGNGYFCRFYVAATKHFRFGAERLGLHLAYIYNNRKSYHYNGLAVGVTYNPSFAPQLRFIAEYDSRDFSIGATYELFNQLHAQIQLQSCKYLSGGLTYKVHLK